jgi:branched-chain amino acid transport system substrate-binding protein
MMLADAIRTADSSDAAAVRDALARTNGYYVTGHIRFDANRNPIKSAAILEIARRDGRLANVYRTTVNPRY